MHWDLECDALFAGSGAGALTGAFVAASEGLDTLLVEATDKFGGTTCYSGGAVWLPGNQASQRDGLDDTNDMALDYFKQVVGDRTPRDLQEAFVRCGPKVVEYLERSPHIKFFWFAFPDYYADIGCPPAHARGRDVLTLPLPLGEAGEFADKVRTQMPQDIAGLPEVDTMNGGRSLVGRLLLACRDAGVRLRLNSRLDTLIEKDGRVIGAVVLTENGPINIRARRGVVMAAGGFERNQAMRDDFAVPGAADWSAGAPGGQGDAIRAGIALGAATDLMDEMWHMPGLLQPNGRTGFIAAVNGGIMVNTSGQRVGNETGPYDRFGRKMRATESVPVWWIWDASLGDSVPSVAISMPILDFEVYERAGLWFKGDTLDDLAAKIGVSARGLEATVARFNGFCETGKDTDFQRGESPYDVYIAEELPAVMQQNTIMEHTAGDGPGKMVGKVNPCLIPIKTGPFYAAKVVLGDLGTKGGLKTDAHARVLRADGSVIKGLYAAGDTMAAASGQHYPAPGTPIGSCMVFAYWAAMDVAHAQD